MQMAAKAAMDKATFAWAPPSIGLTAVAWLAWETLPISFIRHPGLVVFASFIYVFIALATAYLVMSFVYWISPVLPGLNTARVTRETCAVAVLFPPLVILSLQRSAWALVLIILALAGIATLMWWLHESAVELARISDLCSAERLAPAAAGLEMFQIRRPPALMKQLAPFIAAAFLAEAAALAYVLHERFMMALCLGLATLVFSWHANSWGGKAPQRFRHGTMEAPAFYHPGAGPYSCRYGALVFADPFPACKLLAQQGCATGTTGR